METLTGRWWTCAAECSERVRAGADVLIPNQILALIETPMIRVGTERVIEADKR